MWAIETNYGWEVECTYDTKDDALADLKEYCIHVRHYGGMCRVRRVK